VAENFGAASAGLVTSGLVASDLATSGLVASDLATSDLATSDLASSAPEPLKRQIEVQVELPGPSHSGVLEAVAFVLALQRRAASACEPAASEQLDFVTDLHLDQQSPLIFAFPNC